MELGRGHRERETSGRNTLRKPYPQDSVPIGPSQHDLQPPKFNANRQYIPPGRSSRQSGWDSEESEDIYLYSSSKRRSAFDPYDDPSYETPDSTQPSATPSVRSSYQAGYQTPDTPADVLQQATAANQKPGPEQQVGRDYFRPVVRPGRDIEEPDSSLDRPKPPTRAPPRPGSPSAPSRHSSENAADEPQTAVAAEPDAITTLPQSHQQPPARTEIESGPTQTPGLKSADDVQTATARDIKIGKRKITFQKYMVAIFLVCLNTIFIFSAWYWSRYYFVYLPFIMLPLVLNCIMIFSIIFFKIRNTIRPEKTIEPDHPEDMVYIMPCYNETFEECTKSLNSLVDQVGIDAHKKCIMVVCDGRVRGPGMDKSCADYLLEDIFIDRDHRENIRGAYRAWDGTDMDIEISRGRYKGVPYYCIVKDRNQGKRDSLIVIRSFLYKFNIRGTNPVSVFSRYFFDSMTSWLTEEVSMTNVDHLIGMDADTVFANDCISNLLKESKYPNTVGVCGFVAVDFTGGNWNLWRLYQNAEYTIAQGLRRLHQSIATHKVSCLPGCCQLLKICEWTCGDEVLVELFGYHPPPRDGMLKQIRATASEDRNHVCLLLTQRPKAQTRQALRARAYTDVPSRWRVFLSQRRRWSLGATSNDLLLFCSRHCNWFERILAVCNVLVWCLNFFIVTAIALMIIAFMTQPWFIIVGFASVMIIPYLYYFIMTTWLPETMRERFQYLAGLCMFTVCGPFLNIFVMFYSVYNMDSFGWGKTRMVIEDDDKEPADAEKNTNTNTSDSENDSSNNHNNSNGQLMLQQPPQEQQPLSEKTGGAGALNQDEEANVGIPAPPRSVHTRPAATAAAA